MDGQKHGLLTGAATRGAADWGSEPDPSSQPLTLSHTVTDTGARGGYKRQAPASEPRHRNPTYAACLLGVYFCSLTPRNPK